MKKSIIALLALGSVALAGEYTWTGNGGNNNWDNSGNWLLNGAISQYYPQSHNDNAVVNAGNITINWSQGMAYFGDTNSVTLNAGNNLIISTTNANINVNSFTLNPGAVVTLSSVGDLGFGRDFTVNYGTFTADSHGLFDASTNMTGSLWANGKTVTLTGVLDLTGVTGSGTVDIYKSKAVSDTIHFNTEGLTVIGAENVNFEIVTGSGVQLKYDIPTPAVPEPTTATLSLLALAGLAARRRRK